MPEYKPLWGYMLLHMYYNYVHAGDIVSKCKRHGSKLHDVLFTKYVKQCAFSKVKMSTLQNHSNHKIDPISSNIYGSSIIIFYYHIHCQSSKEASSSDFLFG